MSEQLNNGNYKSGGSFGPEFVHYNMFRRNGTLLGIKKQTGAEYDNPVIESTKPAVYEITIRYAIPVENLNIMVFSIGVSKNPDWNYAGEGYKSSFIHSRSLFFQEFDDEAIVRIYI
ncbi:hypothetical protein RhiirB3_391624 [Rhizophagus irregularis]|nr:hypothetical protein RhiirB3_391624 [Rhizophagus irregularis]